MPVLKVLIDENGDVLGTTTADMSAGVGQGSPTRASMVAGAGQRIEEVTVDDEVMSYAPEALHATIRAQQAK